jgi:hypothetical protein
MCYVIKYDNDYCDSCFLMIKILHTEKLNYNATVVSRRMKENFEVHTFFCSTTT